MTPTLEQRLREGPGEWVPLEEFTSFPKCMEWRLARQYWELHGPGAFFAGEVPYACINDGRLSADTARLVVELHPSTNPEPIRILEVGAGSGLFARFFLDEVRRLSPGLYNVTTYFCTDGSAAMVRQLETNALLAEHDGRAKTKVLPVPGIAALGDEAREGFDLIIANYLVDNLPSTLLRLSKG